MSVAAPGYGELAGSYDALYDGLGKSYVAEAGAVLDLAAHAGVRPRSVLDVACGTGRHLEVFTRTIGDAVGLDAAPAMLAIAADRLGGRAELVQGDMTGFDLGRRFDLVTCLFSSIGHVPDDEALDAAVAAMAAHVDDGGLLVIEPWLRPDTVDPAGRRGCDLAESPERVVARVHSSSLDGDALRVRFAWAVGSPAGVATYEEEHRMPLFTRERYLAAVERAGLAARWHDEVPGFSTGRGLLVGTR